jgi:AraC-like DNA-binding protein
MGAAAAVSGSVGGLTKHALVETREFLVEDVRCRCRPSGWSALEQSKAYGVVFVRSGCFHRRVNGVDMFADPTVVYFERPGDEQQISHPVAGDSCTAVYLSESLLAQVRGGEPGLPDRPLATDPSLDLRQRLLLTLIAPQNDAEEIVEAVISLAADVLERSVPRQVAAGRPATALARRRVVDIAREALAERPAAGVLELAAFAAVSPHHLSRVFKAETGQPISGYRNRLRVRLALERIAQGESCLARLAADLGFSDHGHLSRVVRRELGETPSRLRARLGSPSRVDGFG